MEPARDEVRFRGRLSDPAGLPDVRAAERQRVATEKPVQELCAAPDLAVRFRPHQCRVLVHVAAEAAADGRRNAGHPQRAQTCPRGPNEQLQSAEEQPAAVAARARQTIRFGGENNAANRPENRGQHVAAAASQTVPHTGKPAR